MERRNQCFDTLSVFSRSFLTEIMQRSGTIISVLQMRKWNSEKTKSLNKKKKLNSRHFSMLEEHQNFKITNHQTKNAVGF